MKRPWRATAIPPSPSRRSGRSSERSPSADDDEQAERCRLRAANMTDAQRIGYRSAREAATAALELTFNTEDRALGRRPGGIPARSACRHRFRFARVRVVGSGRHRFTPVKLPRGIRLEIQRRADILRPSRPAWSPREGATGTALIELQGGALVLSNLIASAHEKTARLEHLDSCRGRAPGSLELPAHRLRAFPRTRRETLIAFRSASTQPRPPTLDEPLFSFAIDRPVCRLVDCVLITGGRALQAELGRGLVALSQCAVAAGGTAIELKPANVARHRFDADLVLDRCTLTSERTIVACVRWPGLAPGPDRPWLITSRNCAFLGTS